MSFKVGERVRITTGPYAGTAAVITKVVTEYVYRYAVLTEPVPMSFFTDSELERCHRKGKR